MKKEFNPKFNIPQRRFNKKDKKMVSWRLSEDLLDQLQKVAKKSGMSVTEYVSTVLDQAVVWTKESLKD